MHCTRSDRCPDPAPVGTLPEKTSVIPPPPKKKVRARGMNLGVMATVGKNACSLAELLSGGSVGVTFEGYNKVSPKSNHVVLIGASTMSVLDMCWECPCEIIESFSLLPAQPIITGPVIPRCRAPLQLVLAEPLCIWWNGDSSTLLPVFPMCEACPREWGGCIEEPLFEQGVGSREGPCLLSAVLLPMESYSPPCLSGF